MSPMKRPSPTAGDFRETLSLFEACRRLRVSRTRLRRLLADETLDFQEIRGRLRVTVESILRYEAQYG